MEEVKEEQTKEDVVSRAEAAVAKLEETEKRLDAKAAHLEGLQAERIISGKADAGTVPDKPVEETAEDYAKRAMANDL